MKENTTPNCTVFLLVKDYLLQKKVHRVLK